MTMTATDTALADRTGGAFLRAARQARGWSQRELARRTGIADSNLSLYEAGKAATGNMRLETAVRLLEAFGLDAGDLPRLLDPGIRTLRKDRGWSQRELARRTGLVQTGVSHYETGWLRIGNMHLSTAVRLMLAFDLRTGDALRLLDETPTIPSEPDAQDDAPASIRIPEDARGGAFLRAARQTRGWTQSELARRADIPERPLSDYETGKRSMRLGGVISLLDALGLDAGDLPRLLDPGIKTLRKDRGWSQAGLARRVGILDSQMNHYEAGRRRIGNMRLSIAVRLLKALDLRTGDALRLLDEETTTALEDISPVPDPRGRTCPAPVPALEDARGGDFIRAARQARGWIQTELAARMGITESNLSFYEAGKAATGNMRLGSAISLLDMFGLDRGDLPRLLDPGIRTLRQTRGWTKAELARRSGVGNLSSYESGKLLVSNMHLGTAVRLLEAFGMRLGDALRLLDETTSAEPDSLPQDADGHIPVSAIADRIDNGRSLR